MTQQRTLADGAADVSAPAAGVRTDLSAYWTLAETVVWALTRDASRVAAIPRTADDDGLPTDAGVMVELLKLIAEAPETASPPQVVHPDAWELLPRGDGYVAKGDVFEDLIRRVRDGQVKARGQRPGSRDDDSGPIPPNRWDTLNFQSMPDGLCGALSKETLWVRVQFRRREVTAWWPARGAPAPFTPDGTFSFAEIADEVVRLNPGTAREDILKRLDRSFGEGEFEREKESTVLFEGPEGQWWPRDREFLTAARDMPDYARLHRAAFRLPRKIIRDWAIHWRYELPPGFTHDDAEPSAPAAADRSSSTGAQPAFSTIAAERRCQKLLSELMTAGPPTKTKAHYRRDMNVGSRAFDRAWANAVIDVGEKLAEPWRKPGPKPKS